ncbi:3-oxoacyl-ACP reductase [Xanthomonas phaseoli pv. syngonii LMG 9055]|uniref:3-oxoacyl-ACP reductase n=1 Tax=Xanthomonas phaseoli pv. syngonii LMG 9055 TaxID=1437878 RepID=A0A1V9GXZ7_9XANT|nr:3-oxoacyl-ACP reductase [Xanthomonas phaseoli pv. syngonii LMG 9055]
MDLGIAGRWALVCAASNGLGLGCARALAGEGVNVVIAARGREALEHAANALRALPGAGQVRSVVADIATPEGRSAALAACPQVDILINNAGGPPPGDFRQWEREDWLRALDANMLAPIELIRATVDDMRARRFGRVVNITSSAVKAPIDILGLSNGARAGLTGFVAGLAQQQGSTVDEIAERKRAGIPAARFGEPDEFGAACAFLCSAQAGYITGQNLLIDGGSYPGTF